MQRIPYFFVIFLISSFISDIDGLGVAYGACQTGCCTLAVACYAAAGFTFGTVTAGVGTPVAIVGCNSAFGICSAKCAALTLLLP